MFAVMRLARPKLNRVGGFAADPLDSMGDLIEQAMNIRNGELSQNDAVGQLLVAPQMFEYVQGLYSGVCIQEGFILSLGRFWSFHVVPKRYVVASVLINSKAPITDCLLNQKLECGKSELTILVTSL